MSQFPGDLSELEFVDVYQRSILRKPQVVADAILKTLLHAETGDRSLLVASIAMEMAEACRRLTAVYFALNDRRYSIARTLMRPLPGVEHWREFVQKAATLSPEQMLFELSLPDSAMDYAKRLRAQAELSNFAEVIEAAEAGAGMAIVPPGLNEAWFAGMNLQEQVVTAGFMVTESDAAVLADVTAEVSAIGRGFLSAYLGARRSAGRRE